MKRQADISKTILIGLLLVVLLGIPVSGSEKPQWSKVVFYVS